MTALQPLHFIKSVPQRPLFTFKCHLYIIYLEGFSSATFPKAPWCPLSWTIIKKKWQIGIVSQGNLQLEFSKQGVIYRFLTKSLYQGKNTFGKMYIYCGFHLIKLIYSPCKNFNIAEIYNIEIKSQSTP